MKAKEYVEEYANTILLFYQNKQLDEIYKIIEKIFISLSEDVEDICEMRHSTHNNTVIGAIKQTNDKWNAIGKGLEKKIGLPVLKRDGFARFWFKEMPDYYLRSDHVSLASYLVTSGYLVTVSMKGDLNNEFVRLHHELGPNSGNH